MVGGIDHKIHSKTSKICLFKKIYKEVKSHSSEESEDKLFEGERDNYNNYEYLYYFLIERAPARIQGWNGGWDWVVWR